jgi:hypothetical protein
MTALGLRPSGRLGVSPRHRRLASSPPPPPPPFLPDQLADLAFWYRAGAPQNTVTAGAVEQAFDLSGHGRHASASASSNRPLAATDPDGRAMMRFDGSNDALLVSAPPSLAAGVTVFIAYRIRQHVNGGGIIAAGKAGSGSGSTQFFEFNSQFSANRTALVAKTALADRITTVQRVDPTDKSYAIFKIDNASAELRDFLGAVTDVSTSAAFGTPDVITIGSRAFNQFATTPYGFIDVYEVGLYPRPLAAAELDQLESYLKASHQILWSPGYLDSTLAWWHDDWSAFTLNGALVDQWSDRSGKGRHWTASGAARPTKTTDAGEVVVRHDGVDDVMTLAGAAPALQPFTAAVVYRLRTRADFVGILSAAAATGIDHTTFWTFECAAAASGNIQLFGRSLETGNPLVITVPDSGAAQVAAWTANAGSAALRTTAGVTSDSYAGSFGTPAVVALGARYNAVPFSFAAVDVMATLGFTSVLASSDQQKLVEWASAKWGV